jgi:hypothetical protein
MERFGIIAGLVCAVSCVSGPPDPPDMYSNDAERSDAERLGDMNSRDAGLDADADTAPSIPVPTRYVTDGATSPITPWVVQKMRDLAPTEGRRNDQTFIKVGASETVSDQFLACFSAADSYDLGAHEELETTVRHFNQVRVDEASSFDRASNAAMVGVSADWATNGDGQTPLEAEVDAMNPRFAVVTYGTNDMQQGANPQEALFPFVSHMESLVSELQSDGIIPVITGLPPRDDSEQAAAWSPTYSVATRAIAEKHQVPFIDLHYAMNDLPSRGLADDGIHANAFEGGACILTEAGLQAGYNRRNLLTLQTLDVLQRTVLDGEPAPDRPTPWLGSGAPDDPFVIEALPFTHHASTSESPHALIDGYPGCDEGQDESGAEFYYQLNLDSPASVRAIVFDASADVDVHLLGEDADPNECVARDHRLVQAPLEAGKWTIVVDTFVSQTDGALTGPYSLVVVECEAGDTTCP